VQDLKKETRYKQERGKQALPNRLDLL